MSRCAYVSAVGQNTSISSGSELLRLLLRLALALRHTGHNSRCANLPASHPVFGHILFGLTSVFFSEILSFIPHSIRPYMCLFLRNIELHIMSGIRIYLESVSL
jgi:hypothetical protein